MKKIMLMTTVVMFLLSFLNVAAQDYKLGPGDVLSIKIWDEEDLSGDFKINPEGQLILNWLPPIVVTGLNLDETKAKILEVLKSKYVKNPQITSISITEYSSYKATLMGEVKKPGDYKIDGSTTMLDLVLQAGGPGAEASDNVILLRKTQEGGAEADKSESFERQTFSLHQLMTKQDPSSNIVLKSSDVIYIPSSRTVSSGDSVKNGITVIGAVNKIGVYQHKEGYTAMNAIIDAGGFTKYAAQNKTMLIRGEGKDRKTYILKMGDVMNKGQKREDFILKPGDIIVAREGFL